MAVTALVAFGASLYFLLVAQSPALRAGGAFLLFAIALFAASRNWRPHSLRVAGLLAVVLILAILVSIGRGAQRSAEVTSAARELDQAASAIKELKAELGRAKLDPATNRHAIFERAKEKLQVAIDEFDPTDDQNNADARANLEEKATKTLAALRSNPEDENAVTAAQAEFAEQLAALPESDAVDRLNSAVSAAIKARDRLEFPPQKASRSAIAAACAVVAKAGGAGCAQKTADLVGTSVAPAATTLPVSMAVARLRLAEYRQAVLNRAEDVVAVTAAKDALQVAVAQTAQSTDASTSLLDAAGAGANAVVSDIVRGEPPIVLETIGWVVLAAAALLFWRAIERRSFAQLAGPVTITLTPAKPPDDKTTDAALTAAFRTAVLRNLSEPGALPGASAIQPVTDLLELPGVDKTWFTPIVTAVKNVTTAPRGCAIAAEIVPPSPPTSKWRILVRVTDLATGAEVDVSTQQADTAVAACRAAGYWSSAVVLGRSTRIPGWAHWDKDTASALAIFDDPDTMEVADWAAATARAPSSGLLLMKLAQAHDLKGQQIESLTMAARAVAAHPRFMIARYRLAASLNMLGDDITPWSSCSWSTRRRLVQQIRRAGDAIGVTWPDGKQPAAALLPPAHPTATDMHTLATAFYQRIDRDLRWSRVLLRSLRRNERDIWWAAGLTKFGRNGPRYRAKWSVRSARLVSPTDSVSYSQVETQALRTWSWFQLSYNLACYHARRDEHDKALTWLETSLERPGSWQITDGWLNVDPDLEPIRGTARYAWVRDQVTTTATDEE